MFHPQSSRLPSLLRAILLTLLLHFLLALVLMYYQHKTTISEDLSSDIIITAAPGALSIKHTVATFTEGATYDLVVATFAGIDLSAGLSTNSNMEGSFKEFGKRE